MAKTARRCPRCNSHNTWGMGRTGLQVCDSCDYRWAPCGDQYCRGYRVFVKPEPGYLGCPDCDRERGGIPTSTVRQWPEVWRAVGRELDRSMERDRSRPGPRTRRDTHETDDSPEIDSEFTMEPTPG